MAYTVLIVDDDKYFRAEFRSILEGEYEVLEASDGAEALRLISNPHIIDLVLLDVKMPGLQGTEVLKCIKELDPELMIIIFTGYGTRDVIIESLRRHADDFLEKPLKIDLTLQRIRQLLANKQHNIKGIIAKLKYFVEKNFQKEIGLKQASEIVCLSPKYISKIFKEETGIGFSEYKLRLRIEKAKELMSLQIYNINEIAGKVGYLNVESFVRIFKNQEGMTPSEYKHKQYAK